MFSKKLFFPLLFLAACSRGEPGQIINGKVIVTADRVTIEEKKPLLSLAATLVPSAKIQFRFPFDVKVGRVGVRLGERVPQGAVLFELDEADLSLKLATLKASVAEKKSLADKNQYFLENKDRLLTEGKIDQIQFDSLQTEAASSKAAYEHLQAEAAELEKQISDNVVRAPFDGVIAELAMAAGAKINAGDTALSLVRLDPIDVSFEIYPEEITGVAPDMNVDVTIEGVTEKPLSTPITFISPELDIPSRTFFVRASLPNKDYTLKGGMKAEVRFLSQKTKKILEIPAKALFKEEDKDFVYVVRENKAWPVRIFTKAIAETPEIMEVEGGLNEKDVVVTEGQQALTPGIGVNLWR